MESRREGERGWREEKAEKRRRWTGVGVVGMRKWSTNGANT